MTFARVREFRVVNVGLHRRKRGREGDGADATIERKKREQAETRYEQNDKRELAARWRQTQAISGSETSTQSRRMLRGSVAHSFRRIISGALFFFVAHFFSPPLVLLPAAGCGFVRLIAL